MNTGILKELGFSEAEIKVYLALLELGSTKSGALIGKTGLANSVVYRALDRLIKDGLASYAIRGKTKHFLAVEPKRLINMWEDKKVKLEKMVPLLEAKQKLVPDKTEVQTFVGWKGMQTAFNYVFDVLPKGSEYIAFATLPSGLDKSMRIFFKNFHRKRISMRYKVKLLMNQSKLRFWKEQYGSVRNLKAKYVNGFAPENITVFGDHVLIVTIEEQKPVSIIIASKAVVNNFRTVFERMWVLGRSV